MSKHTWQQNLASSNARIDEELSSDSDYSDLDEYRHASSSDSSDSEDNSSIDFDFHLRSISPFLFRNGNLEPLTFVLMLNDFNLESKAKEMIVKGGGLVYSSDKQMDIYSIVLVKEDNLYRCHHGPAFKIQFLIKCIKLNKIVNINRYIKTFNNAPALHKFDFMNVVYYKSVDWSEVPSHVMLNEHVDVVQGKERIKASPPSCSYNIDSTKDVTLIDSSDDSLDTVDVLAPSKEKSEKQKVYKKANKHTRMPYSAVEDANIVKYIVSKNGYDSIRGNRIWINMENANIFPNRTWQSLKEHFLKKTLHQTDYFNFLTDNQKKKFRKMLK